MRARALFQAGKLDEAIESLGADLRSDPTDAQRRTFLFELLCFAGQYDRAEKQLDILAQGGQQAGMGALLYRSALHADRTRQAMFREGDYPRGTIAEHPISGTLNGRPFASITDADPRIGARLEVFAAGQYTWIPLEHIATVRMSAPTRLRDLLWTPAVVRTGPSFKGVELGEVLLPAMTPRTAEFADDAVRLGRVTEWLELEDGLQVPVGQKMLLVDGEEFPLLELRELDIVPVPAATS
ncbi:MAG TPA: type VI secretion system accessory protein TagJ [Gemmatimonadaceae bacterium]